MNCLLYIGSIGIRLVEQVPIGIHNIVLEYQLPCLAKRRLYFVFVVWVDIFC
jgi:hypothetical protein